MGKQWEDTPLKRTMSRGSVSISFIAKIRAASAGKPYCLSSKNTPSLFTIVRRNMSSSGYLVDDPKYGFLKDLGLEAVNKGVYNGKWSGCGEVKTQYLKSADRSMTFLFFRL